MISRHEERRDTNNVWMALAASLAAGLRTDVGALVRAHLDAVVPGEWDFTMDLLPRPSAQFAFKSRLQVLGVIREGVGCGMSYEDAAQSAFLAAAHKFGITWAPISEAA